MQRAASAMTALSVTSRRSTRAGTPCSVRSRATRSGSPASSKQRVTTVKDPAAYERMQMAGLDPDGQLARRSLQLELDYFRRMGYYTGALTLDDILDTSHVDAAAQRLGPYR